MPVTREKLYEEVWAESMLTVAPRHGVSSSFLARICKRLGVPRPPRGYWAKRAAGKRTRRPPLPEPGPGDELEWWRAGESGPSGLATPRLTETPTRKRKRRRGSVVGPHRLLVGARQHFDAARVTEVGFLRPWKKLLVDVFVTKGTLDRAIETADALFLGLERRGHRVVIAPEAYGFERPGIEPRTAHDWYSYSRQFWEPIRPTVVFIGDVAFGLTLFEERETVECRLVKGEWVRASEAPPPRTTGLDAYRDWTSRREVPTGRLCLRAYAPYRVASWERRWSESKPGELMGKLHGIAKELEAEVGPMVKRVEEGEKQAEIARQRWEIEKQELRRKEAERQRLQNIKDSREQLFSIIEAWGEAVRIEAFFQDAERRAAALPDEEKRVVLDRLTEGRALIGSVDPLRYLRGWKSPKER